jgi:hypothetical protein
MTTQADLIGMSIAPLLKEWGAGNRVGWQPFLELMALCLVYNVKRTLKLGITLLAWLWSRLLYFLQRRISTELPDAQGLHKRSA